MFYVVNLIFLCAFRKIKLNFLIFWVINALIYFVSCERFIGFLLVL